MALFRDYFSGVARGVVGVLAILAVSACKTPGRGANHDGGSELLQAPDDEVKLNEFQYETDPTFLKALGSRVGCRQAGDYAVLPASGSMKRAIEGIYAAKIPYDFMQQELFNSPKTAATCAAMGNMPQRENTDGMRDLINKAKAKNIGITFIMVGGFGSHLTEDGALSDSRALWAQTFAPEIESKHFRIVRHECLPNSYASDEICSPKLIEKFKSLDAETGGMEHRYLLWGYSKGGTTILHALGLSPELREKTLALISLGSPIAGGLPIDIAYPLLESLAQRRAELTPMDRTLLNTLIAFGAGGGLEVQAQSTMAKMAELLEEAQFDVLRGGFRSILPGVRKPYLFSTVKNWDFSRNTMDPLTSRKEIPLLHVGAALDVGKLRAVPVMTVDSNNRIVPQQSSQDLNHLSELAMLGTFKRHPVSDSCVALEHAVIPKNAVPRGATTALLGVLNLDHMSLGFSKPSVEAESVPRVEIVDALIESASQKIGVN